MIYEAYVEYADASSGPDSLTLYRRYPNVCTIFAIAAVVPVGSEGLKSPFAAVLEAAQCQPLRSFAGWHSPWPSDMRGSDDV
ncbi:hypothetical protein [Arthrobacter sp. 162MFSha1.1]|uniref:hypothetical protein n=1 Tax=Arthrobacter sp. 162MFSha1.1 TaxID=1151119 RepID=UPI0003775A65|nr:hypothetical protein [Arthrobacter sp. 162MFSha1.1]